MEIAMNYLPFLSQSTVTVEKLKLSKSNQLLSRLVPSRTQSCDRPLELRTRLFTLWHNGRRTNFGLMHAPVVAYSFQRP